MVNKFFSSRVLPVLVTAALASSAFVTAANAQQSIKIGVPTSLSGPFSSLGNEAKRAVEFAATEANAKGGIMGRKIEVKVLDTETKPEGARKQAEKLALDGYKILTGTITSGEGLAMGPMLERWDALYMITINKADALTGEACVPRMFRVNRPDYADAAAVKPWLTTRKEKKWAIIAADMAWGRNSAQSFNAATKATGREVVAEHYPAVGTNDYAPFIQQLKGSGAEGLWVALAGRDGITFAQQAKQFGLFDKVFTAGVSFATSDNVAKALGEVAKGLWGIINYSSTLDTPGNNAFVAAWKKAYNGDEPTNFEGETYVGMQVILQAIAKAKSDKPADLVKAMEGGTFDTVNGRLTMRAEDHQLAAPNHFGYVGEQGGKIRSIIAMSVPAAEATPPQDKCKMPK
ncbi:MAG: ABC transporter substrate-binding protein [Betaproteobacteria bacterium]|nr:ABC transporter substrate-binding protein [Betaproteobacteria bacterium]